MGDMIDAWREGKKRRKNHRANLRDEADASLVLIEEIIKSRYPDSSVSVPSEGHWVIKRGKQVVIQWWPSAKKWQKLPSSGVRVGGLQKFIEFLETESW